MNFRIHHKYKTKYRFKNWASYDRALVRRGDIKVWLLPEAIATWEPAGHARSRDRIVEHLELLRCHYDFNQKALTRSSVTENFVRVLSMNADSRASDVLSAAKNTLAFSCKSRLFRSCEQKRMLLFADKVTEDILLCMPHRFLTFSIPKAIRGILLGDRRLVKLIPRCAFEAIKQATKDSLSRDSAAGATVSFHEPLTEADELPQGRSRRLPDQQQA